MPRWKRLAISLPAGPDNSRTAVDALLLHLLRPELFAARPGALSITAASLPRLPALGPLHGSGLLRCADGARASRPAGDRAGRLRARRQRLTTGQAEPNADRILFHVFTLLAVVCPEPLPSSGPRHISGRGSVFLCGSHTDLRGAGRAFPRNHRASVPNLASEPGAVRDLQRRMGKLQTRCPCAGLPTLVARALPGVVLRSVRGRPLRRSEISRRLAQPLPARRRVATQGRQPRPLEPGELHDSGKRRPRT